MSKGSHGWYTLARRIMEEFDGDKDQARDRLLDIAKNDTGLADFLKWNGADYMVRYVMRDQRGDLWSRMGEDDEVIPEPTPMDVERSGVAAPSGQHQLQTVHADATPSRIPVAQQNLMAQNYALSWMEYPLSTGMKIGDATKQDLLTESQMMIQQGREMIYRGQWMSRIADRVPFGKTVSEVLTEGQIKNMMLEAKNAA